MLEYNATDGNNEVQYAGVYDSVSTTICYDSISAVGDTISAADGQKLLAFAILNIPAGVDIEYTSIILSVAEV